MDLFIEMDNTKFLDNYDQGEQEEICSWTEQSLNHDFSDWEWNSDENAYEYNELVDGDDCTLNDSEYIDWTKGEFEAYRIYRVARVFQMVRLTMPLAGNL